MKTPLIYVLHVDTRVVSACIVLGLVVIIIAALAFQKKIERN